MRHMLGPWSTVILPTTRLSTSMPARVAVVLLFRVGERRAHQLGERAREALRREIEDHERLLDALAADLVGDQPRLARTHAGSS